MALFKIEKGLASNLATARPNTNEGWCYFTTDDGKFYIDIATGTDLAQNRVCLNAAQADYAVLAGMANELNVSDAGSATQPVYFKDGIPVKTTYTLKASVPAGAKFTDTTYSAAT